MRRTIAVKKYAKVSITFVYLIVILIIANISYNENESIDNNLINDDKLVHPEIVVLKNVSDYVLSILESAKMNVHDYLTDLFGCIFGRFMYLCLNSWVMSSIFSFFIIKKFHRSNIMKLGVY